MSNIGLRNIAATVLAPIVVTACSTLSDYHASQASSLLRDVYEIDQPPGIMAAVMKEGDIVWTDAIGHADLENDVSLNTSTRMRIGSVSKTFTAVLALLASESGQLDLDLGILELTPELSSDHGVPITASQLAAHTSGIRQYNFSNYLEANNVYFYPSGPAEALSRYEDELFVSLPGEQFIYSSIGFNVLGVAIERATDQPFAELLRKEIVEPVELENTLIDHPLAVTPRRTRFYTLFPDGSVQNTIWRDSSDFYPSGGLLSTAEDLVKFADAVFRSGFLNSQSREAVLKEAVTNEGIGVGYTFGWQIGQDSEGRRYYEHSGETNGAYATVRHYHAENVTVAGIMNMNFAVGEPVFFKTIADTLPKLFLETAE